MFQTRINQLEASALYPQQVGLFDVSVVIQLLAFCLTRSDQA